MDAINSYINNVFASFPKTERVEALKRDMLAGMEEKYHALKREGKSEHEAVGSVISNFGSIDEIAQELGVDTGAVTDPQDVINVSSREAQEYLACVRKCGRWIGLGVWLVMAGLSAMFLIGRDVAAEEVRTVNFAPGALGILALFAAIVAAVVIFIINGMALSRYEAYNQKEILLDSRTRADLERQHNRFMSRFAGLIATGVAAILLGVGAFVLLNDMAEMFVERWPLALMLFVIGFAVFLIVTGGTAKSAFDVLLGKGEYKNKKASAKAEKIISTVASVYWPLMVAAYLLWSFISGAWNISWVIWPAASLLFGAFAGGISNWSENKPTTVRK